MSISNVQLAANRQNAQLSTGPVTPSGKQIAARNSAGPIARFLAIAGENPDELDELIAGYTDALRPGNPIEVDLVRDMAVARWRKSRLLEFEASLLDTTIEKVQADLGEDAPRTKILATALERLIDGSKTWNTLQRYIKDAERTFNNCMKQLTTRQPAKPAEPPRKNEPISEPAAPVQNEPKPHRYAKDVPLRPNGYPVNLALAL